jgi:PE-PPE domain
MTGATATVAAPSVKLAALITPANSTAQIFAGSSYYGVDYSEQCDCQPQVVPFFLGPQGIVDAIDRNGTDPDGIVVLSSGWGAGQTGTALAIMQANDDPAMDNLTLVVLDNNSNRAGGGFWTTYWMFAPLLLTSAEPTPSDLNVPVVDVAYEYNINSDAPTYPINLLADANSLVAYVYGYGAQSTAPVPQEALDEAQNAGPNTQHYHYVVAPDGTVVDKIPVDGDITYVTFQSDGLPLVRPLRMIPGGDIVADAVEPTLTELVNLGYQDSKPIPDDPGKTRPVGLLPPLSQTVSTVNQLPGAVQEGAQAAQEDLSSPSSLVTLPAASSLPTVPKLTALSTTTVDMTGGNKVSPRSIATSTSSSGGTKPLQQVVGGVRSALSGLADRLTDGAQKTATTSDEPS